MQTGLALLDWLVIGLYFCGLVVLVWWSSRKQDTSADYFLASRNVAWFVVGASVFASNIGSEHIVGLSGNGATSGMGMAHWELHAWVLIMLAWVFVPFYYRSGVFTMPEFLERRFNTKARWILSIVSLVAYVFTKVSVTVYAGGMVFGALLPDTFGSPENAFWIGALATVILTGIYTVPTKIVDGEAVLNGDQVFPVMVSTLLPVGLRGLVVGGLMAALMSSLSSLFNSCASLFTIDIYEKIYPNSSERVLVNVGRIATGVVVALGIVWTRSCR